MLFKQPVVACFSCLPCCSAQCCKSPIHSVTRFCMISGRIAEYKDTLVVQYPSVLLSVSQMAEVVFILAILYFLKRYGIKTVMLISMIAWTLPFWSVCLW